MIIPGALAAGTEIESVFVLMDAPYDVGAEIVTVEPTAEAEKPVPPAFMALTMLDATAAVDVPSEKFNGAFPPARRSTVGEVPTVI